MEPIQDYAVVGDGRSAALVSRGGSIDWLCWPRFDSPSLFGALLDRRGGLFRIAPTTPFRATRRYVPGTNVLETLFETDSGACRITDAMSIACEADERAMLLPDHELARLVDGVRGTVELELELAPRPGYGRESCRLRDRGPLGIRAELPHARLLTFRTDLPVFVHGETVRGTARVSAGERRHCSLTFEDEWPAALPPLDQGTRAAVERSIDCWRAWSSALTYEGPCREAVERSALVLKLLAYAPSGAIIAAPTTSLPERVGGDLNWDYRYCWLRDASLTVRALFGLGYAPEAEAFVSWLLHSTRLSWPALRILYDVHGNRPTPERVLEHLSGYLGSRPVRVGNGAIDQLQLDVYGEVVDAVVRSVREGGEIDGETEAMLNGFGEFVCRHGTEPDEGIWEPRSGRRHSTHSRVLCWSALDRLLELHAKGHCRVRDAAFRAARDGLRREIEERAWNERLGSYTATLDGDELDASTLLLPWYGFERADSPRMRSTYARIRERLGARDGLLYRYRNGDSPGEGAFGICSFWGAEYLALGGGTVEEAVETFEKLVGLSNDVGLFAEEIDPATGAALGNFPQAFTHVGLINAALSLARRLKGEEALVRRVRPCRARRAGAVSP